MDRQVEGTVNVHMDDGCMDEQVDGWTGRWMDRWRGW